MAGGSRETGRRKVRASLFITNRKPGRAAEETLGQNPQTGVDGFLCRRHLQGGGGAPDLRPLRRNSVARYFRVIQRANRSAYVFNEAT